MRGKVETETEQDLSTLFQFHIIGDLVNTKFLPAHGALFASVSQGVQLRSGTTCRADQMARSVAMHRTHFIFEVRQQ